MSHRQCCYSVDKKMECRELSRTPSLPESSIAFGIGGRTQEVAEIVPPTQAVDSATMAPNVGLPYLTTEEGRSDLSTRRDTGYVSHPNLSTPDDFRLKASGRLRPHSNVDSEIYFAAEDRKRAQKNVTFRGIRRGGRQTSRSPSSSSADSSEGESDMRFVTRNRRHRSGRLSGGAQDPPIQSGGASEPRPFGVTESCDGRSELGRYRYGTHMEEEKRHRGDRMNRGTSPRCRSTPDDASSRRHGGEEGPSRRVLPTIKLGTYNGSTCLGTD